MAHDTRSQFYPELPPSAFLTTDRVEHAPWHMGEPAALECPPLDGPPLVCDPLSTTVLRGESSGAASDAAVSHLRAPLARGSGSRLAILGVGTALLLLSWWLIWQIVGHMDLSS